MFELEPVKVFPTS